VVINDFNGFRASVRPEKAQAVLVVDADAVLTCPITSQGFQPVAWRDSQVVEAVSNLQLPEAAAWYRDIGRSGSSTQHSSAVRNGCVSCVQPLRGAGGDFPAQPRRHPALAARARSRPLALARLLLARWLRPPRPPRGRPPAPADRQSPPPALLATPLGFGYHRAPLAYCLADLEA
jgi:hypothetical protein